MTLLGATILFVCLTVAISYIINVIVTLILVASGKLTKVYGSHIILAGVFSAASIVSYLYFC